MAEKDTFLKRHNEKLLLPSGNYGWALWLGWDDPNETGDILWVDFRIIDIMYIENGKPFYSNDDCQPTEYPDDAEIVIDGFIKWDGCCQWWAHCAHTDDPEDLKDLCEVIQSVYERAKEVLTRVG